MNTMVPQMKSGTTNTKMDQMETDIFIIMPWALALYMGTGWYEICLFITPN